MPADQLLTVVRVVTYGNALMYPTITLRARRTDGQELAVLCLVARGISNAKIVAAPLDLPDDFIDLVAALTSGEA